MINHYGRTKLYTQTIKHIKFVTFSKDNNLFFNKNRTKRFPSDRPFIRQIIFSEPKTPYSCDFCWLFPIYSNSTPSWIHKGNTNKEKRLVNNLIFRFIHYGREFRQKCWCDITKSNCNQGELLRSWHYQHALSQSIPAILC